MERVSLLIFDKITPTESYTEHYDNVETFIKHVTELSGTDKVLTFETAVKKYNDFIDWDRLEIIEVKLIGEKITVFN